MATHRRAVRPRFGRIAVAGVSLAVTGIALLGGIGILPLPVSADADGAIEAASFPDPSSSAASPASSPASSELAEDSAADGTEPDAAASGPTEAGGAHTKGPADETDVPGLEDPTLPADSGSGRRVVFSEGQQRVWIVSGGQHVKRTYLVSGSLYDNLDPGSYEVYSRSQDAWGVDGSTMHYFVRFTQGDSAAIGFHTIPELGGSAVQTVSQLGTPLSHGCIRQQQRDAIAMWHFAQLGTSVVVTA
ncbi:MAG: L,D-transpeptidase [Nocardioidaceae bacterium]